jgi:hypothetical protein
MVWLAGEDLVRPKELLQQHHTRELVWKRERSERKPLIGPLAHARVEAEGASDHEAEVAPGAAALLEPVSERGARQRLTLAIERSQERPSGNASQDRLRLAGKVLGALGGVAAALANLDRLESRVSRKQSLVVGGVVGERRAPQPPDAHESYPHGPTTVRY